VSDACLAKIAAERGWGADADQLEISSPFTEFPVREKLGENVGSHLLSADVAHLRTLGNCNFAMNEC